MSQTSPVFEQAASGASAHSEVISLGCGWGGGSQGDAALHLRPAAETTTDNRMRLRHSALDVILCIPLEEISHKVRSGNKCPNPQSTSRSNSDGLLLLNSSRGVQALNQMSLVTLCVTNSLISLNLAYEACDVFIQTLCLPAPNRPEAYLSVKWLSPLFVVGGGVICLD